MPNLLPSNYKNEVISLDVTGTRQRPVGYKKGFGFDFYETGDFMRDGKNAVTVVSPIESWKIWITKCLQTQRYAYLAYSTDYGIDINAIFSAKDKAEAESILVREVTEALLADPYGRADYVEFLMIDWSIPNGILSVFTVHGIDDVTIDIATFTSKEA